jgi:Ferritin-like domain/TAT (twin-arginine translocation) pathway signal sequence
MMEQPTKDVAVSISRRNFFKTTGALAGGGILLAACSKSSGSSKAQLGAGDNGILNYLYVIEQLQAAFYTSVINTQYTGITASEAMFLTNIRDHEIAHRDLLLYLIGNTAIAPLVFNFASIDFTSRTNVLTVAQNLEDLGVSAYNYVAPSLTSANNLLAVSKIVSVEGRHAAYIRDTLNYNSFADITVVSNKGLDESNTPASVINTIAQYLTTTIDYSQLP